MHPEEVTASSKLKNKKSPLPQGPSMRVIMKFHKVITKKITRTALEPTLFHSLYNRFKISLQKQSQYKPYSTLPSHI